MQCDHCLHVTFTMNQLYLVGGGGGVGWGGFWGQYRCTVHFPLYAIVSGHRKLYINLTNPPLLQMVTLNQFYLVKGGPGIIALHSFLYLQSCRVTAYGILLCRISLTNLPL